MSPSLIFVLPIVGLLFPNPTILESGQTPAQESAPARITVTVALPKAAPAEVETGVCIPIEKAIAAVEGIQRITSSAARNEGVVCIEVCPGHETHDVLGHIKSRVDAIPNFAEKAEMPIIKAL